MQEGKHVSNGEFNGESMGSQPLEMAVSSLFPDSNRQKNQQLHFCKLLIIRAENGTRTRDLNLGKVALYQLSYFRKIYLLCRGKPSFPALRDCKYKMKNLFCKIFRRLLLKTKCPRPQSRGHPYLKTVF